MKFDEKKAMHDLDLQLLTQDGIITNPVLVSHITNHEVTKSKILTFEELLNDENT